MNEAVDEMAQILLAANYNCTDSADQSYGAGGYSTCDTTSIGAPSTGFFQQITDSGSIFIILPVLAAIVLIVIGTFIARRKRSRR